MGNGFKEVVILPKITYPLPGIRVELGGRVKIYIKAKDVEGQVYWKLAVDEYLSATEQPALTSLIRILGGLDV